MRDRLGRVPGFVADAFPWPVGVGVRRAEGGQSREVFPEEEAALSPRAVERRREQFRVGRAAAHEALRALGVEPVPILRGEKGEPVWPAGVVGSITHTEGIAIAVVGRDAHYAGIGVDLEALDPGLRARTARFVCTEEEIEWAAGDTVRLTMLFSAKEAIFKAVYPLTRVYLDFKDADLRWVPEHEAFTATLRKAAGHAFPVGYTLRVTCRRIEGLALATTFLPAVAPG